MTHPLHRSWIRATLASLAATLSFGRHTRQPSRYRPASFGYASPGAAFACCARCAALRGHGAP